MRIVIALAIAVVALLAGREPSQAALYQRPAGAEFDFLICSGESDNPRQGDACTALGLFECSGKIEGNGFLVLTKGPKNVIVTSSHTLIDESTRSLHGSCRFLLRGQGPGLELQKAVLLNRDVYDSLLLPDLAAVLLEEPLQSVPWPIPMEGLETEELPAVLSRPSIDFSIIAIHPWRKRAVMPGYRCLPVRKMPDHIEHDNPTVLTHNCPTLTGFSGSPGMLFDSGASRYVAVCVHSASFGPGDRKPFDPAVNPNVCAVITAEFIDLVNRLAGDEPFEVPEGGALIDYMRLPSR